LHSFRFLQCHNLAGVETAQFLSIPIGPSDSDMIDGSGVPELLTPSEYPQYPQSWSADGKLLFRQRARPATGFAPSARTTGPALDEGGATMVRDELSIIINRRVEEVFAFVTDPRRLPVWNSAISDSEVTSDGPIDEGSTFRVSASFLGKRFDTDLVITAHEPHRRSCIRATSGPIPAFSGCYVVESAEGGTRFTQTVEAELGRFFGLAESLVVRAAVRHMEADMQTLKDLLESRDATARE
jgi:carbon monoxide dehydrogenase subunit G